ncbi:MAG: imidazolonepropionase [Ignavibacteria bacterium GWB2_35_6b]|nr:MAG: imidazolonepropionase [Ignavibacteria bacterium GWB2_35_6b]
MKKLYKNPSQIVTVNTNGVNFKRGKELSNLEILTGHSIIVEDNLIKTIVQNSKISKHKFDEEIDLTGKVLLPGLVECHTHTAYAGSRADEFKKKLSGVSYEQIAKAGGGINTTVQAVRKASFEELVNIIKPRVDYFISQGITTLEIKSGYGLSYYDEIKLLQVINYLDNEYAIDIIPTFLGAHTFPPEYKNDHNKYIDIIVNELLPFVAENKLAKFCDAFCEKTAFTAPQVDKIFNEAQKLGLSLKLHTEQFNNIGGLDVALKLNAQSVDHLEVISENDLNKFSDKETVAVLLPGVSFFLNYDFAPARKLIDANAIVALATDYNPGSSHIANLNLIMTLAALKMKMTIEETISAVTINAAKALNVSDKVGSIEVGKNADFAIFDISDYSEIVYQVGKNLNCMTVKNGNVIYKK